jgi:toxin ParE1/3/4
VLLARRFRAELQQQISWINEDRPRAADAAEKRVRVAIARLSRFPEIGRLGRVLGTRELVVPRTRFVIVYRLSAGLVEILALMQSSQNWPTTF